MPGDLIACATQVHLEIRADRDRWESETLNRRPWNLDGEQLEIGECVHCNSTIARAVESIEAAVQLACERRDS